MSPTSSASPIRALVFDFDGLILDTETPQITAWENLHLRHHVPVDREHLVGIIGHSDIDFDPWSAFPAHLDRSALDHDHHILTREIRDAQVVLPGVINYLDTATRLGLHLAIASNSTHDWVDSHLRRLGLFDRFAYICCRDDVARGKPAPDPYLRVLAHFGLHGHQALALEDSLPGTQSAKAAGLWCAAVPNPSTRHHDFSHTDWRLDSLASLPLEQLLARVI